MDTPALTHKLRIVDVVHGKLSKEDNALQISKGEAVSRLRVMGTVIDTFSKDDGSYSTITLDDGTETIQARAFREDTKKLENINKGDLVDILGRPQEYEGEIYVRPDGVQKLSDPNWELLRKLELEEGAKVDPKQLEKLVIEKIRELDEGDGANINDIKSAFSDFEEKDIIDIVRNLMMRGDVFEPTKGNLRLI
jgi:RPA family protein